LFFGEVLRFLRPPRGIDKFAFAATCRELALAGRLIIGWLASIGAQDLIFGQRDETMSTLATVHLVDDDPEFLAATRRFVRSVGFQAVAFSSVADLLAHVSADTRGCVIADMVMPDMSGLELQQLLTRRGIMMPVVFLTGQGNIPSSVQAMRDGAVDFIEKLAPREQLTAAIACALDRDAESHLKRTKIAERQRKFSTLTQREREVLSLLVQGNRNKVIAGKLGITERTIKHYRRTISDKLGVESVAQLTTMVGDADLMIAPGSPRL
jgi:two-component system, LuxR family, response regulator FixJ